MPAQRKQSTRRTRKWSGRVTRESDALRRRVYTWRDPKRIAGSLAGLAERSRRRMTGPYQSAMSMLNFYVNRGGRKLTAERRRVQARAKTELRRIYDKPAAPRPRKKGQKRG